MTLRRGGVWLGSIFLVALGGLVTSSWWSGRPERHLAEAESCLTLGEFFDVPPWLVLPEATARTRDRARILRARNSLALGRPTEAVGPLDAIDPSGPAAVDAAFWKGRTLLTVGQSLRAADWFRVVVAHRPGDPDAHRWLAAALYELGDRKTALSELRQVSRLLPDDPQAWRTIALLLKEGAEPEEARTAYLNTLRIVPAQPQARLELAEVLTILGQFDEADRQLESCSGAVPEGDRLDLLARGLRARGDEEGLQALLQRALAGYPDHAGLLLLRAQVETAEGRTVEAIGSFDRLLALDPYSAAPYYQRGLLRKALGNLEGSASDLARAKELNAWLAEMSRLNDEVTRRPGDAAVRVEIAHLCQQLGKVDLAASWYRAALACDPTNTEARSGMALLRAR